MPTILVTGATGKTGGACAKFLLASGACVVSEPSSDAALDAHYAPALAFAPYSAIVDTAERLARDEHARRAIANAGYSFVCAEQRACAAWLGRALSDPALAWRGDAASATKIGQCIDHM